jgi:EF hand domain-containing protein
MHPLRVPTLTTALVFFTAPFGQAQHPATIGLPVLPPTAAAAGMAQQQAQLMATLDTNRNGRLDPAEIEAAQAGLIKPPAGAAGANNAAAANMAAFQQFMLSKFDANGNGVLDLPEVEAARMALGMASGMNRRASTGAANQPGGNNPAAPAPPIKNVKRKNPLLAKFDKNGNGKLDPEERQAMDAAKTKPHAKAAKPARKPAKNAKPAKPPLKQAARR